MADLKKMQVQSTIAQKVLSIKMNNKGGKRLRKNQE
jgi:hypothetical protein